MLNPSPRVLIQTGWKDARDYGWRDRRKYVTVDMAGGMPNMPSNLAGGMPCIACGWKLRCLIARILVRALLNPLLNRVSYKTYMAFQKNLRTLLTSLIEGILGADSRT